MQKTSNNKRGKKEKDTGMTMRGTPSVQNKSTVIENPVSTYSS